MKKYAQQIQNLAKKFVFKYAQAQNLQQILESAAGYGEQSSNGIMNFPQQLKQDQANLYITITVSNGMLGGRSVKVGAVLTDPREVAGNYSKLPQQIENYLNKHLSSFPQIPNGDTTLTFSGKSEDGPALAQK
jgi:hypothetical protein